MKHSSDYIIEDLIHAGKERLSQFEFNKYKPDFMGFVSLSADKSKPITSGYRPAHQVTPEILSSGEMIFFENEILMPNQSARAYIKLISPECYPHCLNIGNEININEGSRVIGSVKILAVYNPLLLAND